MKKVITVPLISLAIFMAFSVSSDTSLSLEKNSILIRVTELDKVVSENAAILRKCNIDCSVPGRHVMKVVGQPEKLGKFIAHSMMGSLMSIYHEYLNNVEGPNPDARLSLASRRYDEGLNRMNRVLNSSNYLNVEEFERIIYSFENYLYHTHRYLIDLLEEPLTRRELALIQSGIDTISRLKRRMQQLMTNWMTYRNALRSGSSFSVVAKRAGIFGRKIKLTKIGGGLLAFITGEFFFSESADAASIDDFTTEVTPDEYDTFYGTVKMERDRLLDSLIEDSSNTMEHDRFLDSPIDSSDAEVQERALEMRAMIEEREEEEYCPVM